MTFEERMQAEAQERQDRQQAFEKFVHQACELLPENPSVVITSTECYEPHIELRFDHRCFSMSLRDGRVCVGGKWPGESWPRDLLTYYERSGEEITPSTRALKGFTVAAKRGPEALAKALTRFLPDYDALHARVVEAIQTKDAAKARREALAAQLQERFHLQPPTRHSASSDTITFYGGATHPFYKLVIEPDGQHVDLTLTLLTSETAARVLEALKGGK